MAVSRPFRIIKFSDDLRPLPYTIIFAALSPAPNLPSFAWGVVAAMLAQALQGMVYAQMLAEQLLHVIATTLNRFAS